MLDRTEKHAVVVSSQENAHWKCMRGYKKVRLKRWAHEETRCDLTSILKVGSSWSLAAKISH